MWVQTDWIVELKILCVAVLTYAVYRGRRLLENWIDQKISIERRSAHHLLRTSRLRTLAFTIGLGSVAVVLALVLLPRAEWLPHDGQEACPESFWAPVIPPFASLYLDWVPPTWELRKMMARVLEKRMLGQPPECILPTINDQSTMNKTDLQQRFWFFVPNLGLRIVIACILLELARILFAKWWGWHNDRLQQGYVSLDRDQCLQYFMQVEEQDNLMTLASTNWEIGSVASNLFLPYWVFLHLYIWIISDISLARGFANLTSGVDWEVWEAWFDMILAIHVSSGILTYWNVDQKHQSPTVMVITTLLPIIGNDVHILKDHFVLVLCVSAAQCSNDAVLKVMGYAIAIYIIVVLYGHLPILWSHNLSRRALMKSHWPIPFAMPRTDVSQSHSNQSTNLESAYAQIIGQLISGTSPDKEKRVLWAELPLAPAHIAFAIFFEPSFYIAVSLIFSILKLAYFPVFREAVVPNMINRFKCGANDLYFFALNTGYTARFARGRTCLHFAAKWGHVDVINALLDKGASLKVLDERGYSPLVYAIISGEMDVVELLCRQGSQVQPSIGKEICESVEKHKERLGKSLTYPLDLVLADSIGKGDTRTGEVLLRNGACVKSMIKGLQGPLHNAVENSSAEWVKFLLERDADTNDTDDPSCNAPLHLACLKNDTKVIHLLLEHGATIDCKGADRNTPLHSAVTNGSLAAVRILVDKGADVLAKNNFEKTPQRLAVEQNNAEILEVLIQRIANGEPLQWAVGAMDVDVVKVLLCEGMSQEYAVHMAARKNAVDALSLLLSVDDRPLNSLLQVSVQVPALMDAKGFYYTTGVALEDRTENSILVKLSPLHLAAKEGSVKSVELLLARHANISDNDCVLGTPLHLASMYNHKQTVELLLEKGANKEVGDVNGGTALHSAVAGQALDSMLALLQDGANIAAVDMSDLTPLSVVLEFLALEHDNLILQELLNYGALLYEPQHRSRISKTALEQYEQKAQCWYFGLTLSPITSFEIAALSLVDVLGLETVQILVRQCRRLISSRRLKGQLPESVSDDEACALCLYTSDSEAVVDGFNKEGLKVLTAGERAGTSPIQDDALALERRSGGQEDEELLIRGVRGRLPARLDDAERVTSRVPARLSARASASEEETPSMRKSFYREANRILLAQDWESLAAFCPMLRLIALALQNLPRYDEGMVFRGWKSLADYQRGDVVTWWGFSSCAVSLDILNDDFFFGTKGDRTAFILDGAVPAYDIQAFSFFQKETEVLVPAGASFEVKSFSNTASDMKLYNLRAVATPANAHAFCLTELCRKTFPLGYGLHPPEIPSELTSDNFTDTTAFNSSSASSMTRGQALPVRGSAM